MASTTAAAAATFLFPVPPLPRNDVEQSLMNSDNCRVTQVHFAVRCFACKYNFERYSMPLRVNAGSHGLRCLTTKRPLKMQCTSREGSISVLFDPEDIKRSNMLTNSSIYTNPANDFEKQLDKFFTEIMNMLEIGNKDGALDLLQANYEAVKEQIIAGNKNIEEAAILDVVALGYVAVGDLKLVENLLKMLTEIVDCLSDDLQLLDSILIHMGSMFATLGKFDEAMLAYTRGLGILEHLFGKQSPFLVMPLLGVAKVFKLTGKVTEAIEVYHRTISVLEINRGIESRELVVPLFALGDLLINEGRAADAESSFKRILKIYIKSYGENDGRVGMAMCSLAHAICAKGDVEEAISLYQEGLEVIEDAKYLPMDDDVLVMMRIYLAELFHVAGRVREGRELLEKCLLIAEKCEGSEHPSLASHLINLATSYSRSKNFVEAERMLRVSVRLMSKTVGPNDQSVTIPMLHLAIALYNLLQDREAESIALDVLRIREDAFGKQSLPVGEALDCLISIQIRLGKDDDEVLTKLKRLLRIQERALGNDSEDVMLTLKKIVFYLDKMGRRDEKLPLQRRLTMLTTKYRQMIPV